MADQADVETALVTALVAALYPNGTAAASAVGPGCRVYRGWPLSAALNADVAAGTVNVSVIPVANSIKPLPCFANDGWIGPAPVATLSASWSGNQVTFAGVAGAGQLAGVLVNGKPYVYSSVAGDTVTSAVAALAGLVSADWTVSVSGASMTVAGADTVIGRVGAAAGAWMEIRRQRQSFNVMVWCPTPPLRDTVVALLDLSLAGQRFLTLADGSSARLVFADTVSQDQNQNAGIFRRDLIYHVEYATTVSLNATQMLFGGLGLDGVTAYS
jgi:hypothetical protein